MPSLSLIEDNAEGFPRTGPSIFNCHSAINFYFKFENYAAMEEQIQKNIEVEKLGPIHERQS